MKQLFKQPRRRFPTRPVVIKGKHKIYSRVKNYCNNNFFFRDFVLFLLGLADLFQCDLADVSLLKDANDSFTFLMLGIDTFSKFLFCVPLKRKTGLECSQALEGMFQSFKKLTKKSFALVQTDHGKEFHNKHFAAVCKKWGAKHFSTYSNLKAQMVERVNY